MVTHTPSQYQAYSIASRTVAKTRQVVILYDNVLRFLRQAEVAIDENRIEDRFKLLQRANEIIVGLQSSIDFESGGEIAHTLHQFYTGITMRILSINMQRTEGKQLCGDLINELKQMRDVWDSIDKSLNKPAEEAIIEQAAAAPAPTKGGPDSTVSMSA